MSCICLISSSRTTENCSGTTAQTLNDFTGCFPVRATSADFFAEFGNNWYIRNSPKKYVEVAGGVYVTDSGQSTASNHGHDHKDALNSVQLSNVTNVRPTV